MSTPPWQLAYTCYFETMNDGSHLEHFSDLPDGISPSCFRHVRWFKATDHQPKTPHLYSPGICFVLQGHKIGTLGGRRFQYDANHYLVASMTMPIECESFATPKAPLLGLYIEIDSAVLHDLISRLSQDATDSSAPIPQGGMAPAKMDPALQDAVFRLIRALGSPVDAEILGEGLYREVIYRALCGEQAHLLRALGHQKGHFSRISRVLMTIQRHYAEKLDVENLAAEVNMSPSTFHRVFKEVTSESPLQYLKKIRLNRAREMMMNENLKAYMAADQVGYESSSQFSREFKRYFGHSPADLMRELRAS